MAIVFSKFLTKTDIEKRLSVPSAKRQCFLDFGGKHQKDVKVIDEKGEVWEFGCSIRKKEAYPKPVFSRGWLRFVKCWKLAVGDKVRLYKKVDRAGKERYVIEVVRRASEPSSSWVQNRDDADHRTKTVASYSRVEDQASHSNIEDEPALTSLNTDRSITSGQTEELRDQSITGRVGLRLEFVSPKPQKKAGKTEFIDFFGSQERREREQPSFPTFYNVVEIPMLNSTVPYYKFI